MNNICIEDLEQVYDYLAESIDAVAAEKRELFLVKLALLSVNAIQDKEKFIQLINQAKQLED
ncbi:MULTISPECIES: hypothetical protein [unclassified Acinetobacter]|uniref:hypothetical protein n=1 Tax=unclassified Acinetobacter TaxID=196816 RepID=UPI0029347A1B|nr:MULTISPECIES: hypothetical protein [unclassified Acinetobacter]WOE33237.1 hypothetical protein QSG84_15830 [Acinetobacter sp. SAAs470]WOE36982.1 hypothetical protein QSG86_01055 [Acinetobacter sp. SAAs474]